MYRIIDLLLLALITSCTTSTIHPTKNSKQKEIYRNWVLSRCLNYTLNNKADRQDALNTASSYLYPCYFKMLCQARTRTSEQGAT